MTSARGIIATGHNAMVVAFTGTEPLSLQDWITDFDVGLSFDDIQHAYQSAVDAAWTDIGPAIADNAAQGNFLFVTGHSMGGALAVIAAARAAADPKTKMTAVYTIGGARAGGQAFADAYPLPDATFRLVYGDDMVTALPPLSLGYRHVGRMLYCPRGKTFADVNFSPAGGPDGRQLDKTLLTGLGDVIAGQPPTNYPLRSPPIALLFRALPPGIADHVPDTYLRALGQAA
jgi:acetyl esterase/lipase